MDERVAQARVGIVVISALILTAILIVLFGDFPSMFHTGKTIRVRFTNAPGVAKGTPVRKSGILVGRVSRVEFVKDSPDVMVTLSLNAGTQIYEDENCSINNSSLLGNSFVEFVITHFLAISLGGTIHSILTGHPGRFCTQFLASRRFLIARLRVGNVNLIVLSETKVVIFL